MFSSEGGLPAAKNINCADCNVKTVALADETERFTQTYPLNTNGRVSVSNVNGSVTIETWDRNEVKLDYVKTADTRENLAEVTVRIDARQDAFSVETDYGDWKRRNSTERRTYGKLQVEYRLTVPRGAVLNSIETVNGSVNIAGAGNLTKASSVNGEVRATNLRGTANLTTVNGTVVADFNQLQTGSRISLNTVNGTVDLMIPSDANVTIKADTVNGSITNDFGLPVRKGQYVGRDLYGKVGTGDVQIRLNSVNGGLSIKRKNDGKNVNPAINLLNMKNEDNEDWDDEGHTTKAKAPKPPKVPKPVKPVIISGATGEVINRSVEEALKQAEKEIERMGPELEQKYAEAIKKASTHNSEETKARLKDIQTKYKDAMARMPDGYYIVGSPAIDKKTESFKVKGTPKVTVNAKNCAVSVRGWDKSEVSYSLVKVTRNTQNPTERNSTIVVNNSESTVDIKVSTEIKTKSGIVLEDDIKMRLEVYVPKNSNLKIISDSEIRLEGVSGDIDLQGADEAINVRDADGKLRVGTADGRIRVIGFRGSFDGRTDDGMMNLEGDFQSFKALATDGTIVLTLPEDADAVVEANTEIEIEGVDLVRSNAKSKTWRVGKGGKTYRMNVTDGKVIVRSAGSMTVY
jgi:DUF4097 and DUF4098 domain-containing protein YvlB